jgi:hypothetical protein
VLLGLRVSFAALIGLAQQLHIVMRKQIQSHWGIDTMAVTKKSLINGNSSPKSPKKANPKAAAAAVSAAKLATTFRTTLRVGRAF